MENIIPYDVAGRLRSAGLVDVDTIAVDVVEGHILHEVITGGNVDVISSLRRGFR